jgi:hypothetical protein
MRTLAIAPSVAALLAANSPVAAVWQDLADPAPNQRQPRLKHVTRTLRGGLCDGPMQSAQVCRNNNPLAFFSNTTRAH